jgi:hypothetical protein
VLTDAVISAGLVEAKIDEVNEKLVVRYVSSLRFCTVVFSCPVVVSWMS